MTQAHQIVDAGKDGQFLQHTRCRLAVPYSHVHAGFKWSERGFDLPAPPVPRGEVVDTIDRRIEQRRDEGHLTGPKAWRAALVAHLTED